MTTFYHYNFNVLDLDRSLAFYREALKLSPVREKEADDGSFKLVFRSRSQVSSSWKGEPASSPRDRKSVV